MLARVILVISAMSTKPVASDGKKIERRKSSHTIAGMDEPGHGEEGAA